MFIKKILAKNKFELKTSSDPREIVEMCRIALEHRLYVPMKFYTLKATFKCTIASFYKGEKILIQRMSLIYYDGEPIGVAIAIKRYPYTLLKNLNYEVFVKRSLRRKGIGSRLIQSIHSEGTFWTHGTGIQGSRQFFEKNKLLLNQPKQLEKAS